MRIANGTNHNYRHLKLTDGVPTPVNGKMVQRARLTLNIGPLSRFDDHKPNYVRRLRESFKRGEPLVDLLKPCRADALPPDMTKAAAPVRERTGKTSGIEKSGRASSRTKTESRSPTRLFRTTTTTGGRWSRPSPSCLARRTAAARQSSATGRRASPRTSARRPTAARFFFRPDSARPTGRPRTGFSRTTDMSGTTT